MANRKIAEFKHAGNTVKVSYNPEFKEYRARIYHGGIANENADYFSDDKADALQTAQTMLKECTRVSHEPSVKSLFASQAKATSFGAGQLENI